MKLLSCIAGLNIRLPTKKVCIGTDSMAVLVERTYIIRFSFAPSGIEKQHIYGIVSGCWKGKSPACREKGRSNDERSEIAACYRGIPNDLTPSHGCKVDNCPKEHGIHICCFRSMSADHCGDELGLRGLCCGGDCARCVSILGTISAGACSEVLHRLQMADSI